MRSMVAQRVVWGACLAVGLMMPAKPSRAANCALYARAETGVALFGAAGGWWDQAEGRYERGHVPAVGAILVFKRTGQIPSGHVAVVARIISAREILVDHANWYHGTVSRGMSVVDTSPAHDWTSVAVINPPSGTHGRDYPTYGFVYPGRDPREIAEIPSQNGHRILCCRDSGTLQDFSSGSAPLRLAVATEDQLDDIRVSIADARKSSRQVSGCPLGQQIIDRLRAPPCCRVWQTFICTSPVPQQHRSSIVPPRKDDRSQTSSGLVHQVRPADGD